MTEEEYRTIAESVKRNPSAFVEVSPDYIVNPARISYMRIVSPDD